MISIIISPKNCEVLYHSTGLTLTGRLILALRSHLFQTHSRPRRHRRLMEHHRTPHRRLALRPNQFLLAGRPSQRVSGGICSGRYRLACKPPRDARNPAQENVKAPRAALSSRLRLVSREAPPGLATQGASAQAVLLLDYVDYMDGLGSAAPAHVRHEESGAIPAAL